MKNPNLNGALLRELIKLKYKDITSFAREHFFCRDKVSSWCFGRRKPNVHQLRRLCDALGEPPQLLTMTTDAFTKLGKEMMLTKWALGHLEGTAEPISDKTAISYIQLRKLVDNTADAFVAASAATVRKADTRAVDITDILVDILIWQGTDNDAQQQEGRRIA